MVSTLYLMPTERCNCVCGYCYLPGRSRRGDPDLFRRIARSFTAWINSAAGRLTMRPQIRFTGGEPWMEPGLLADTAAHFLDGVPEGWVVVNTNGTLFADRILRRLAGEERFKNIVSIDGPPAVHDSRRRMLQAGSSWRAAWDGAVMLREAGLPVYVNTVLDDSSILGLPGLMSALSGDLGLRELSVSLLLDTGREESPESRFHLLRRAYSMARDAGMVLGGHHRLLLGGLVPGLECMAGRSTALVDAAGEINACQRFVGRSPGDCTWTEDFDWEDFRSVQGCGSVCRNENDRILGRLLFEMYRSDCPEYLSSGQLDRVLFGVIP